MYVNFHLSQDGVHCGIYVSVDVYAELNNVLIIFIWITIFRCKHMYLINHEFEQIRVCEF